MEVKSFKRDEYKILPGKSVSPLALSGGIFCFISVATNNQSSHTLLTETADHGHSS